MRVHLQKVFLISGFRQKPVKTSFSVSHVEREVADNAIQRGRILK